MSAVNIQSMEIMEKTGTGDGTINIFSATKSDPALANVIAVEVINEILENALDIVHEREAQLGKELENDSKITKPIFMGDILQGSATELKPEDINKDSCEVKKVAQKHSKETSLPTKGLGDQLCSSTEVEQNEPVSSGHRKFLIEKKNRLTDLLKNSKHILSKFILNDAASSHNEEADVKNEAFLQVIELDCVKPEDIPFKVIKKVLPEEVPLPEDDEDILNVPDDSLMDVIQIASSTQTTEKGGTGDDINLKKTMTFPLCGNSSKSLDENLKCQTLKVTSNELKKKKKNIGTKIINYIKKYYPKRE